MKEQIDYLIEEDERKGEANEYEEPDED